MNIKKGIDRISIVVALMVIIAVISWIAVSVWNEGFQSLGRMAAIILGVVILGFLVPLYGIRGISRIILWVIEGFEEEKKTKE